MAQAGAVVDVVGAETLAHQLLEEVGLFIGTLGRAEAGQTVASIALEDVLETLRREIQSFLPGGLPEVGPGIVGLHPVVPPLGRVGPTNEGHGQALGAVHIVPAEATLHAEALLVGRAVSAVDLDDLVVLDGYRGLAAHAAEGAEAVDGLVRPDRAQLASLVQQGLLHESPGRAGLDAFPAGNAGAGAHGIIEVEDDLGVRAAVGHADDVVDLDFTAGAHAEAAVDAGVEVDRHCRVADVLLRRSVCGKTAFGHTQPLGPLPELGIRVMAGVARRLIGDQQLEDHLLGGLGLFTAGGHYHSVGRRANAGGRQHTLTLDFDHAGAAVAIRPIPWLGQVAEMGNFGPFALSDLPDRLSRCGLDRPAVKGEANRLAHQRTSSGKYLRAVSTGLGAACPRPQIDAPI